MNNSSKTISKKYMRACTYNLYHHYVHMYLKVIIQSPAQIKVLSIVTIDQSKDLLRLF